MAKRSAPEDTDDRRLLKRSRTARVLLFDLSDELLLRILSHASVLDLMTCQRVSRKFSTIASDPHLWKAAYYNRFVRPRVKRLSRNEPYPLQVAQLPFSAKLSEWLDEESLVRRGKATNWQRQYKIRHKWAVGSCGVDEIPIDSPTPAPPLLARLQDGIVYTVDKAFGLRAWDYKHGHELLGKEVLTTSTSGCSSPTSLAVDSQSHGQSQRIAVGLENGSFAIYRFHRKERSFRRLYSHPASSNGPIEAVALFSPYLFTANRGRHAVRTLSLYKFGPTSPVAEDNPYSSCAPTLLSSLRSDTISGSISLSLRRVSTHGQSAIVACIAYGLSGPSIGIQELQFDAKGTCVQSRLARSYPTDSIFPHLQQNVPNRQTGSKAACISYSHPYCLVSNMDNTLSYYLISSTPSELSIRAGERLFGHSSGVVDAHVAGRGKAVSVSFRGREVRVWELEGSRKSRSRLGNSVRLSPRKKLSCASEFSGAAQTLGEQGAWIDLISEIDEPATACDCVGFDDENLVIITGQSHGAGQSLMVYDFT